MLEKLISRLTEEFKETSPKKLIVLIALLLLLIALWINLLFFSGQVEVETENKEQNRIELNEQSDNEAFSQQEEVDLYQLYGIEKIARESPFLKPLELSKSKFSYQSDEEIKEESQQDSGTKLKDGSKIDLELEILGIVSRAEESLILLDLNGESKLAQVNEQIYDFKIEAIMDNKLIIRQDNKRYSFDF
ncbi:hypothetical protein MWH25_02640 [Natroniella acetigena]|uniref:hypothetical protein n=1 Tax=Natroniella acetigena TaxID=52004 RepID=UPI00200AE7C4|nr:hypothetical protein [Natroniella acetigena]MCK8826647.1 hypothetical protein [Natroniella acetigena]